MCVTPHTLDYKTHLGVKVSPGVNKAIKNLVMRRHASLPDYKMHFQCLLKKYSSVVEVGQAGKCVLIQRIR